MHDKVCLITGSSSGIGKATALELAKRGATVVMVCRDRGRAEIAQAEIKAASNNPETHLLLADLSSQAAIRQVADELTARFPHLQVLINNAGLQLARRQVTVDGLEMTFAVNHLAPFLLTNLLLDVLKRSAPARVINVSSLVHKWGIIDFDDLQTARHYDSNRAYYQSKLANVLFTYELARRLHGTGVTVNSFEPGMTRTAFARDFRGFYRFMAWAWRPFMKSAEQAAETAVFLATSPHIDGVTGKHFVKKRPVPSSRASHDVALSRRLWQASEILTQQPAG